MPRHRTLSASVNLDAYFTGRYYDERFLQFLRCDPVPAGVSYVLTLQDDKLSQFYDGTMQLKRAPTLDAAEHQLRLLNRIAEQETNWIVYPLYVVAHQLLRLALALEHRASGAVLRGGGPGSASASASEALEHCGRTIHRSFNLCLNDRNPQDSQNRRTACYSFANLEFRLYHVLNNRDMTKNLVKVLQSRRDELPPLHESLAAAHKSHLVTYHYYLGEYYGCHVANFASAFHHLSAALRACPAVSATTAGASQTTQLWHILLLLIPHAMLARRWYPNWRTVRAICPADVYEKLYFYYGPATRCLVTGDVRRYDEHCARNELFFLRHGLYVTTSLLRDLVLLKQFKNCWRYGTDGTAAIVPLTVFLAGKRAGGEDQPGDQPDDQLDELECQLANQIAKGNVKGYLSHGKRCIVLSKKDPFPRMAACV